MTTEKQIYSDGVLLAQAYLGRLNTALGQIVLWQVAKASKYLRKTADNGGTVWCVGNGGSHANASHLSLHLQERGIHAVDLMGEGPIQSALSNDFSYEGSLAQRLLVLGAPQDTLVIISGSGNSLNLIAALAEARRQGMVSIGLLGFGGGMALSLVRIPINLHLHEYGPIEDAHSAIIHILAEMLGNVGHGPISRRAPHARSPSTEGCARGT